MKIGILTIRPFYNYGGIFQCLALQEILKEMGHDVYVISFCPQRKGIIKRRLKLLLFDFSFFVYCDWLYGILKKTVLMVKGRMITNPQSLLDNCKLFNNKNLHFTISCDEKTIGQLVIHENYDAIVIGSDQVWSGLGYEQLTYMGDWLPLYEKIIVSYAACSCLKKIPHFNHQKIRNLFERFQAISVRDEHTRKLIAPFTPRLPQLVADPTLLYDFKNFICPDKNEVYIFVYILGREIVGGHHAIITEMKKKLGNIAVKAVVFNNQATDIISCADEVIENASPETWLNLLVNAQMVYTDSFHAIIFSLKYRKFFLAYYRSISRTSRLIDIRDKFDLNRNIISSVSEAIEKNSIMNNINFEEIDKKIEILKKESMMFLKSNFTSDSK